jgi:hypothetical protein
VTLGVFSTACALICALVAAVAAWLVAGHAVEARRLVERVTDRDARLIELEQGLASLLKQHTRLRGKFYAEKPEKPETVIARTDPSWPACENWLSAQTLGPSSPAAKCGCDYCISKRNDRDAARAKLVPKTHAERRDAIEKGRH